MRDAARLKGDMEDTIIERFDRTIEQTDTGVVPSRQISIVDLIGAVRFTGTASSKSSSLLCQKDFSKDMSASGEPLGPEGMFRPNVN